MSEPKSPDPEQPRPDATVPASGEMHMFDAEPATDGSEAGASATAREWTTQLQSMIDNIATHAAPAMREIGAKAAELAAIAGEKAGPIARRAADATADAGSKLAERGRVVAADLRRDAAAAREGTDGSVAPASEGAPAAAGAPAASGPSDAGGEGAGGEEQGSGERT